MNEFGEYLKGLRGKKSLREMERITGISHTYLSTLEKGFDPRSKKERKPTPEVLKNLSDTLGINYLVLMNKAGYLEDEHHIDYANKFENLESEINNLRNELVTIDNERAELDIHNTFRSISENKNLTVAEKNNALNDLNLLKEKDKVLSKKWVALNYRLNELIRERISSKFDFDERTTERLLDKLEQNRKLDYLLSSNEPVTYNDIKLTDDQKKKINEIIHLVLNID